MASDAEDDHQAYNDVDSSDLEDDDDDTRLQINEDEDAMSEPVSISSQSSSRSYASSQSASSSGPVEHFDPAYDHLYNLTQLAEVSLAYFNQSTSSYNRKSVICNTKDIAERSISPQSNSDVRKISFCIIHLEPDQI